jgi:hypothetical protein
MSVHTNIQTWFWHWPNYWLVLFFIVPTHALHYTLKHLKFAATCFGLLWNHPQGVHGCTLLGYWIGMLIFICYKECRYVAVCQFIPSVCVCVWVGTYLVKTMSWNELTYSHIPDTLYNKCKSTFQFSNVAKYGLGLPEDGFKWDRNMYGWILNV